MIYGSVCSGIEAASVAWHPLGWRPAFFAENDAFPSAVLETRFPDVPNYGDITDHGRWPATNLDVLVGGTPCQSFSIAGLREGLDDPRGDLTLTYLAIAEQFRPRWLVWENVPGVLSQDNGRAFGSVLGGMAELGYGVAYRVLDAQYVRTRRFPLAVPQRRRRVFVVGHLGDWRPAAAVLFERESLSRNPPPRRQSGKGAAASLTSGAGGGRSNAAGRRREDDDNLVTGALPAHTGISDFHMGGGLHVDAPETSGPLLAGTQGAGVRTTDLEGGAFIPDLSGTLTKKGQASLDMKAGAYIADSAGALTARGPDGNGAPAVDAGHYVADVCGALSDGAHNGGGLNGQDAHSGRIIAQPVADPLVVNEQGTYTHEGRGNFRTRNVVGDVGDGPPEGKCLACGERTERWIYQRETGRDLPVCASCHPGETLELGDLSEAAIKAELAAAFESDGLDLAAAFDETQVTHPENRSTANPESAPTLADRARPPAVAFKPSHYTRDKDGAPDEATPPLSADADKGDQDPVIFETRVARNGRGKPEPVSPPLKAESGSTGKGDSSPTLATGATVRRLTPRECERLQGFPDDWTLVPYRGGTAKDGPRYKALGNSMAVNVMEWIGERIAMVDLILATDDEP